MPNIVSKKRILLYGFIAYTTAMIPKLYYKLDIYVYFSPAFNFFAPVAPWVICIVLFILDKHTSFKSGWWVLGSALIALQMLALVLWFGICYRLLGDFAP